MILLEYNNSLKNISFSTLGNFCKNSRNSVEKRPELSCLKIICQESIYQKSSAFNEFSQIAQKVL